MSVILSKDRFADLLILAPDLRAPRNGSKGLAHLRPTLMNALTRGAGAAGRAARSGQGRQGRSLTQLLSDGFCCIASVATARSAMATPTGGRFCRYPV
jgi:hypothetical protein